MDRDNSCSLFPPGDDRAISFTDEGSPDTRITGEKVCIEAQINRDHSLSWYYHLLQFFPDVEGELKSSVVASRFSSLPDASRRLVWAGLRRVKIHIVDPRSHRHRINNVLRRVWQNDRAPKVLNQLARDGVPGARNLNQQLREAVADSILRDSTAVRVQFLGRACLDPFGMGLEPSNPLFIRAEESEPLITTKHFRKPKSLIRDVASWSAKSSAVFHSALEAAHLPDNGVMTLPFDPGDVMRRNMVRELLPVHAFDDGNRRDLYMLDDARLSIIQELAARDRIYRLIIQRPGVVPVESKESYYVQAADIAAGIASSIYEREGLIGIVNCFEYVTYNGVRVSVSDAEEEMRRLKSFEV